MNFCITMGYCRQRVLRLLYLRYPRNIPEGRHYGGATFNSTNHHEISHSVFFLGLELQNNMREKLLVSKSFLPALFFIVAGDALLKLSWYLYEGRAWKQSTLCQEPQSFPGAHPQGTTCRMPLPAIRLPNTGWTNEVNCPPSPSARRLANILN